MEIETKMEYVREQIEKAEWRIKYHETELTNARIDKELFVEQLNRLTKEQN